MTYFKVELQVESLPSNSKSAFEKWSCDDVASWLSEQVKLGQYSNIFTENEIDGAELTALTSEMLQNDLGIGELHAADEPFPSYVE